MKLRIIEQIFSMIMKLIRSLSKMEEQKA